MALVPGTRLPRRRFLRAAGLGAAATAAGHPLGWAVRAQDKSGAPGQPRAHAVLTAYDAQGVHRTGTAVAVARYADGVARCVARLAEA